MARVYLAFGGDLAEEGRVARGVLERRGHEVLGDEGSLRSGELWADALQQQRVEADVFVFLIGRNYSDWVARELEVAESGDRAVFLLMRDVGDLPTEMAVFRRRLRDRYVVSTFSTPEELAHELLVVPPGTPRSPELADVRALAKVAFHATVAVLVVLVAAWLLRGLYPRDVDAQALATALDADATFVKALGGNPNLAGARGKAGDPGHDGSRGPKGDPGDPGPSSIPPGTVLPFAGPADRVPQGWLLCDGRSFPKDRYGRLARALGGTTLPDCRGYFLRGIDPSGKVDRELNRRPGSVQEDAFGAHAHEYQRKDYVEGGGDEAGEYNWQGVRMVADETGRAGGRETRPKNVAVNWIVRAD